MSNHVQSIFSVENGKLPYISRDIKHHIAIKILKPTIFMHCENKVLIYSVAIYQINSNLRVYLFNILYLFIVIVKQNSANKTDLSHIYLKSSRLEILVLSTADQKLIQLINSKPL